MKIVVSNVTIYIYIINIHNTNIYYSNKTFILYAIIDINEQQEIHYVIKHY